MKILHCADIHCRNDIDSEIRKCTEFVVQKAREEGIDLTIIAGDLFNERTTYDSEAYRTAVDFVRKLAQISPVYVLKGTNSHDGTSLNFLEALDTKYRVYVSEEIKATVFFNEFIDASCEKLAEFLAKDAAILAKAVIFSLPPVSKAQLLAYGDSDIEDSRLETINALRNVLQMYGTLSAKAHAQGVPTILAGHLTVTGSTLSTGQQMVGREVELGVGDLRMTGSNLVCLGHIHKQQSWGEIFYSGSITRLNFGEEEPKGFWIHEFDGTDLAESRFIETPARQMLTVELDDSAQIPDIPEGSFVRVKFTTDEDDVHRFDEAGMRESILKAGAAEVKIEKTVNPVMRMRAQGISQLNSLEEKLRKYAETTDIKITDSLIDKLHSISEEEQVLSEAKVA